MDGLTPYITSPPPSPDSQVPEYVLFDISCVWVKGKVVSLLVLWELEWTSYKQPTGDTSWRQYMQGKEE